MSSLLLGGLLAVWLLFGYRFYGGWIARRLIQPDDDRPTPAHSQRDGVDFHPAKTPVLFGHHFSSIAGAGPIIGPLMGVLYFGWLATVIWIAVGSVFIGAVHDYVALMASTRHQGRSVGQIAETHLGRRARIILSLFLWLALVLVIAVFGVVTAQTLTSQPPIVIPTFGLILLAMLFGRVVLRRGLPLLPATLLGLAALAGLIALGEKFPIALGATVWGLPAVQFWFWILMLYCLAASILPVWLLLQPRDYLSTWILYLGLASGLAGVLLVRPTVASPAWLGFQAPGQGPVWPMLFVLIACGAVSGFHSLVAGGTTSKQLSRETDGRRVGYGAMILEAGLAGLVVLIAAGALRWDPSASAAGGGLQYLMGEGGGPIVAFATGFSRLVDALPGVSPAAGLFFGMLMLNAFVITTLDTATRLGRFILQELGGDLPLIGNRIGATGVTVLAAAWLGASDSYTAIWPVFGATNQLVAALALIVVSSWLVGLGKPRVATLAPALFMLATSIGALAYQGVGFWKDGKQTLAWISIVLMVMAGFLAWEARGLLFSRRPGPARKSAGSAALPDSLRHGP
jgi:carbon starvation protein